MVKAQIRTTYPLNVDNLTLTPQEYIHITVQPEFEYMATGCRILETQVRALPVPPYLNLL